MIDQRHVHRAVLAMCLAVSARCTFEDDRLELHARPTLESERPRWPQALSETGLYRDIATRGLAAGVISYDVRYELWSDGAEKQRYLYLPPGTQIDSSDMDGWRFPIGTKVWKTFSTRE